jgi:hypothetical protein
MDAPCTVILVKQALPFEMLTQQAGTAKAALDPDLDVPF